MKPPTGPPTNLRGKLELQLAEFVCRLRGHKWQAMSMHDHPMFSPSGHAVRTGRVCVRCWDAEAHVYEGQYPVPR